jgi:gluconokinase
MEPEDGGIVAREPVIIILMGVAGAGKTTVGRILARDLGWPFYDGDDFHVPGNVAKMQRGIPLSDADREPWLAALRRLIDGLAGERRSAVIACSALKRAYRDRLASCRPEVRLIHLKGEYVTVRRRLLARRDHFLKEDLLASQFATLEELDGALTIDAGREPGDVVAEIRRVLGL